MTGRASSQSAQGDGPTTAKRVRCPVCRGSGRESGSETPYGTQWFDCGECGGSGTVKTDRYRCPVCGKYPKLTKEGALRGHTYPWYHSQSGDSCPGAGTQITPLAGQTSLEDICEDSSSPRSS